MDSVDICVATSAGDNKRVVKKKKKKNRGWRKRLRRRTTAVQPPTMQSQDKRGQKKITEEREQNTTWPSSKKSPHEAQQSQHRANNSENILRFRCSQCKDNLEFLPKDLVGHFEETHRGTPPVFPCHMCTFSAHEFSYLQVHLLSHKDTFSSCNICKDNVQRTCSEFSTHLTMHHSQNGKYSCEKCEKFSTGDARVFLEHMYLHNLGLEIGSDIDVSVHTKDVEKQSKTTKRTFHCQHCGYEAPQKHLITKHVNAVHVGQNGNQKMKAAHPITVKPNDSTPKMKHRLTRNTVREMCWLSQDCLSLPGREFLDKYCSLSDPETTLEETQQFLMRSTAGETGGQKWTKALQTVLSNVPHDMNLHPKSENGIMSNSGFSNSSKDLTVLTVKNKITVPQNGTTYAKRFKMMAPSEKEEAVPSESATVDAHCALDPNRCQSNVNDQTSCPQTQMTPDDEASISAQNEPAECTRIQENRENQELRVDRDFEEHGRKYEEPKNGNSYSDGIDASKELKQTNESDDQTSVPKARPKNKSRKRRCRRKARSKMRNRGSSALGLKLVLKKNPVKYKQWVSQSSLSLPGGGLPDDHHRLPNPHTTLEETQQFLQRALSTENGQKTEAPKTDQHDSSKAVTSTSQSKPEEEHLSTSTDLGALTVENKTSLPPNCTTKPAGFQNVDGKKALVLTAMPLTTQDTQGETEQSLQLIETEVDNSSSVWKTSQSNSECPSSSTADGCPETAPLQNPGVGDGASRGNDSGMDCQVPDNEESSAVDGATPHRNYAKSSPVSQPVITPEGKTPSEDSSLAVSLEQSKQSDQSVQGKTEGELPTDPCPELLGNTDGPSSQAIQEEPSPASAHRWQPAARDVATTLKLIAASPTQLIKRPLGDQPVVVLNHPDADIPEVTNIMEVVHRYRGEVQKVILSRKTLNALSATGGGIPGANDPTGAPSPGCVRLKNSVQERFILKLKLRRMSRKKYEVVSAVSPSRDHPVKFRCWFCGRVFASQDMWMAHRQRHLMEWKMPNCENT